MQSLAEWKFGSCNVGDKKNQTAGKPRTASAYGRAVKKQALRNRTAYTSYVEDNTKLAFEPYWIIASMISKLMLYEYCIIYNVTPEKKKKAKRI